MPSKVKNVERYYDIFSLRYDSEREKGYFGFINELEIDLIRDWCKGKDILEVGCGTGLILEKLSKIAKKAVGIDISEGMIKKARKKGIYALKANVIKMPFENSSFDVVYSFKTLPHILEIEKAISEMKRICKNKGLLILEFYNPYSLKFILNKLSGIFRKDGVYIRYDNITKIRKYLRKEELDIIKKRGIKIIATSFMIEYFLFSKVVRFLERKLCDSPLKYLGGYFIVVVRKR